ncbi:hypothetical protein [Breoghania sp.]|uniref:hypothetical protein n=1 Tax=Breoghania sp. TaxID=2065378 RepID=UPI00262567E1|nr:hypothetical protein [Breoghania sp.]MDJ0932590.1 hypothetical protein [Breoghania sp.]
MDEHAQVRDNARRRSPRESAAAILLLSISLAGGAPLFFHSFGYPFLPSSQFYEACRLIALFGAVVLRGFCFRILFHGVIDGYKKDDASKGFAGRVMRSALVTMLMMLLVHTAFIFLVPMVTAGVSGGPVTIRYSVKDADRPRERGCASPVRLENMPWFLGMVCGVPDDFRQRLEAEMRVELIDWGTRYGLFYDRIRIATEHER